MFFMMSMYLGADWAQLCDLHLAATEMTMETWQLTHCFANSCAGGGCNHWVGLGLLGLLAPLSVSMCFLHVVFPRGSFSMETSH